MGVLDIICLATDPDSTAFYGFAYTYSHDCSDYNCFNNVLVKSNANPTSGSTLTWSLVSKIDSRNMTGNIGSIYGAFSCAINAQGVFTMFGWTRQGVSSGPGTPFGVRYDPAGTMDAKYNFQGSGAWMNVAIDKAYNWTEATTQHKLGYVNNGTTTDLVHTVIGSENTIYVAKVDEATKTLTAAGTWALNKTMHGVVTAMAIGNNHLYTLGPAPSYYGYAFLTGFPLATISPTTPVGKIYNASQVYTNYDTQGVILYTYQNTLTLIVVQYSFGRGASSTNSGIYKINDLDNSNSTGPPVANFTNVADDMDFFVPLGDGTSPTSFALMKQYGTMYVFGNDNGFRYTHEINKVNITDPAGINPNPKTPSTGSQGDSSSTGVVIGAIVGVVLLGGLIVWLARRGRTANAAKAMTAAGDKSLPPFPPLNSTNNHVYPRQPGQTGGPNYHYPPGQPAPTTILLMAPITPVPQQHQTFQDQMQALQFSSHPRPTVVTTAYSTAPATSTPPVSYLGSSGAPQATWQPTPFVPPARPSDSTTTPSSPANTSGATITATTANTTPAGTPLVPPRVPQVPYATRPLAPQQFRDQDVNSTGVSGYGPRYVSRSSLEMGATGQAPSPHAVVQ